MQETVRQPSGRLRVLFLVTSMPVGGAETLLMNLVRRLDPHRFSPEIACLKDRGPLGEQLAAEMPVHCNLIAHKLDLGVLFRLYRLMKHRKIDAVVTVGAGDKMFWGRLAAKLAGVPVIVSALHSTGWPDSVGTLNRLLTPLTDGFIGVADAHTNHLVCQEGFPLRKVFTIFNGVDTDRFSPGSGARIREELGIPTDTPVVGILAALRPEKNHELFLTGAQSILRQLPEAQFLIIGDGPRRKELEALSQQLSIADSTHFLGSRSDIPEIMHALDIMALTSHNEASPVSILEALSCGVPVVSAEVGSVPETVVPGETGKLFARGDLEGYVQGAVELLTHLEEARELGREGRRRVEQNWSLDAMVKGYETLLSDLHAEKARTTENPVLSNSLQQRTTGA